MGIRYNSTAIPEGKTREPPSNVMTSLSVHGDMMMWKAGCGAEVNKAAQKDTTSRDDTTGKVQFTNKG